MFREIERGRFYRILVYGHGDNKWFCVEDLFVKVAYAEFIKDRTLVRRSKLDEGLFADTFLNPHDTSVDVFRMWFLASKFPLRVVQDYARKIEMMHLEEYERLKKFKTLEKLAEMEAKEEAKEKKKALEEIESNQPELPPM